MLTDILLLRAFGLALLISFRALPICSLAGGVGGAVSLAGVLFEALNNPLDDGGDFSRERPPRPGERVNWLMGSAARVISCRRGYARRQWHAAGCACTWCAGADRV